MERGVRATRGERAERARPPHAYALSPTADLPQCRPVLLPPPPPQPARVLEDALASAPPAHASARVPPALVCVRQACLPWGPPTGSSQQHALLRPQATSCHLPRTAALGARACPASASPAPCKRAHMYANASSAGVVGRARVCVRRQVLAGWNGDIEGAKDSAKDTAAGRGSWCRRRCPPGEGAGAGYAPTPSTVLQLAS